MKIRNGFVTNSSSTSFMITTMDKNIKDKLLTVLNYLQKEMEHDVDIWEVYEDEGSCINGFDIRVSYCECNGFKKIATEDFFTNLVGLIPNTQINYIERMV